MKTRILIAIMGVLLGFAARLILGGPADPLAIDEPAPIQVKTAPAVDSASTPAQKTNMDPMSDVAGGGA